MEVFINNNDQLTVALDSLLEKCLIDGEDRDRIFTLIMEGNDPSVTAEIVLDHRNVVQDLSLLADKLGNEARFFQYLMTGGAAAAAVPVSVVVAKGASEIAVVVSVGVGGAGFVSAGYALYKWKQFGNHKAGVHAAIGKIENLIVELERLRDDGSR